MVEEVLSDDDEWYTLPELEQTATTSASTNSISPPGKSETSDVEASDLDVLWLRFLSSPLLSAGGTDGEDTCNCRRSTIKHEQKQQQSPERNFMFKSIGESRNGLSLAEAFAAQHPQLVRRNRLSSTKEHRNSSAKPLPQKPVRFEDQEKRTTRPVRFEERLARPERTRPGLARPERTRPGKSEERLSKARERKNRIRTFQKEVLDQIRDQSSSKHRPSK